MLQPPYKWTVHTDTFRGLLACERDRCESMTLICADCCSGRKQSISRATKLTPPGGDEHKVRSHLAYRWIIPSYIHLPGIPCGKEQETRNGKKQTKDKTQDTRNKERTLVASPSCTTVSTLLKDTRLLSLLPSSQVCPTIERPFYFNST